MPPGPALAHAVAEGRERASPKRRRRGRSWSESSSESGDGQFNDALVETTDELDDVDVSKEALSVALVAEAQRAPCFAASRLDAAFSHTSMVFETAGMYTSGPAIVENGELQLTPAPPQGVASTLHKQGSTGGGFLLTRRLLADGFVVVFEYKAERDDGGLGLGFALVAHNDPARFQALGFSGAGLGCVGLEDAFSLRFVSCQQPDGPIYTRLGVHSAHDGGKVAAVENVGDLCDGGVHEVLVRYEPASSVEAPLLHVEIDGVPLMAARLVSGDVPAAGYLGFTGTSGPGASWLRHRISRFEYGALAGVPSEVCRCGCHQRERDGLCGPATVVWPELESLWRSPLAVSSPIIVHVSLHVEPTSVSAGSVPIVVALSDGATFVGFEQVLAGLESGDEWMRNDEVLGQMGWARAGDILSAGSGQWLPVVAPTLRERVSRSGTWNVGVTFVGAGCDGAWWAARSGEGLAASPELAVSTLPVEAVLARLKSPAAAPVVMGHGLGGRVTVEWLAGRSDCVASMDLASLGVEVYSPLAHGEFVIKGAVVAVGGGGRVPVVNRLSASELAQRARFNRAVELTSAGVCSEGACMFGVSDTQRLIGVCVENDGSPRVVAGRDDGDPVELSLDGLHEVDMKWSSDAKSKRRPLVIHLSFGVSVVRVRVLAAESLAELGVGEVFDADVVDVFTRPLFAVVASTGLDGGTRVSSVAVGAGQGTLDAVSAETLVDIGIWAREVAVDSGAAVGSEAGIGGRVLSVSLAALSRGVWGLVAPTAEAERVCREYEQRVRGSVVEVPEQPLGVLVAGHAVGELDARFRWVIAIRVHVESLHKARGELKRESLFVGVGDKRRYVGYLRQGAPRVGEAGGAVVSGKAVFTAKEESMAWDGPALDSEAAVSGWHASRLGELFTVVVGVPRNGRQSGRSPWVGVYSASEELWLVQDEVSGVLSDDACELGLMFWSREASAEYRVRDVYVQLVDMDAGGSVYTQDMPPRWLMHHGRFPGRRKLIEVGLGKLAGRRTRPPLAKLLVTAQVRMTNAGPVLEPPILFERLSAFVKREQAGALRDVVRLMERFPFLSINVTGHVARAFAVGSQRSAPGLGSDALARGRAEAVARVLEELGLARKRVRVVCGGEGPATGPADVVALSWDVERVAVGVWQAEVAPLLIPTFDGVGGESALQPGWQVFGPGSVSLVTGGFEAGHERPRAACSLLTKTRKMLADGFSAGVLVSVGPSAAAGLLEARGGAGSVVAGRAGLVFSDELEAGEPAPRGRVVVGFEFGVETRLVMRSWDCDGGGRVWGAVSGRDGLSVINDGFEHELGVVFEAVRGDAGVCRVSVDGDELLVVAMPSGFAGMLPLGHVGVGVVNGAAATINAEFRCLSYSYGGPASLRAGVVAEVSKCEAPPVPWVLTIGGYGFRTKGGVDMGGVEAGATAGAAGGVGAGARAKEVWAEVEVEAEAGGVEGGAGRGWLWSLGW
ncbi:uncharacterized protein AMSG_11678 [Thecamonas trahens ATCC 50062]|uniref:OmpA-like domain-containing protein n=1 Tax=Thecamonas trahens ATCC 50062 TaxID=461836 RepID=A0A0L0DTW3_THETB|nr:hypothetical protein AMSG_11678 [Thecamonas trahens ATCC 50062]KNC55695.1 hypothetical protein AMSG_11678 [Thecamonas trahens ATCC 50062]|eukprot:XP_013761484.1 hypothetical protein AMSG_11678 [Thecamonas trahens ATCC 50062]